MSKETSVKISYGMFISCIVIVLHHSVGDVFYDVGIWGGVIEYLHEGLFSFSMPFFFFWSGYFMMQKAQKEDIQHIISTKMRSLFRLEYYLDVICCNVSFNSFKYFQ